MKSYDTQYIAYYRVSTQKQGRSGLGLEAQRSSVKSFLKCESCLIGEFTDIESGKKDNRPELQKAIARAKDTGAKLVIAKLDRLSRNAAFIFLLKESGVDFVCCDMPEANTLTIGIFATLAQYERELISERTKKALQAKKSQGFKLGSPQNLTSEARAKGNKAHQQNAKNSQANRQATEFILNYRNSGLSFQAIADKLNGLGFQTRTGKAFQKTTVKRLFDRA